jgi:hypothetical protein
LTHLVDICLELVLFAGYVAHLRLSRDEIVADALLQPRNLGQLGDLGEGSAAVLELGQRDVDGLQIQQPRLLRR